MRKFDYSFLDSGMIPADLVNVTGVQTCALPIFEDT